MVLTEYSNINESEFNSGASIIPLMNKAQSASSTMYGLVPRPFHVFQRAQEKSGRPGRFDDVMMMYLPPFLQPRTRVAEMVADMSSLHHQIDQAFLTFLACIEKHGNAWVQGYGFPWTCPYTSLYPTVV